jgi:soluble lytic murein transglycosylase-like protein
MTDDSLEEKVNEGRRDFLKLTGSTLTYLFLGSALESLSAIPAEAARRKKKSPRHNLPHVHRNYAKIPIPKLSYAPLVKEPNLSRVSVADNNTDIGRMQRALRFRNITDAVERRYGIPKDYLLGMICVESEGDPTQPNSSGDGGAGLIHMQPLLASAYGLKMITSSKRLRDFHQGRKINRAIDKTDADLKDLIKYDERFHPIKNIDAAARMICDAYEETHNWDKALKRYAGRGSYTKKVKKYAKKAQDAGFKQKMKADFARRNTGVMLHGRQITYIYYQGVFFEQNRNYGLDAYRKLPAYRVQ